MYLSGFVKMTHIIIDLFYSTGFLYYLSYDQSLALCVTHKMHVRPVDYM